MGLKLLISIFVVAIILANIVVFLFIKGINILNLFNENFMGFINKYLPVNDPLLIIMLLGFIALIIAIVIILIIFGRD